MPAPKKEGPKEGDAMTLKAAVALGGEKESAGFACS